MAESGRLAQPQQDEDLAHPNFKTIILK